MSAAKGDVLRSLATPPVPDLPSSRFQYFVLPEAKEVCLARPAAFLVKF
jgi:hypothetical protein